MAVPAIITFLCANEEAGRPILERCQQQCVYCRNHYGTPGPPTRKRDVLGEAQIIREAARGIADPEHLITFTQMRAQRLSGEYVSDPLEVRLDRDRRRDAREEAADGANHLVWKLQDPASYDEEDERRARDLTALSCFVQAYNLLLEND